MNDLPFDAGTIEDREASVKNAAKFQGAKGAINWGKWQWNDVSYKRAILFEQTLTETD